MAQLKSPQVERAVALGLIEAADLARGRADVGEGADDARLLEWLVKQGLLTKWQRAQLEAGRSMQLDFAFLCNFGGYLQDRRPVVIGAGIDAIEASVFPFLAPEMSLMVRVLTMPDEPEVGHTFRVELTRPTGEIAPVGDEQQFEVARDRRNTDGPAGCTLKADFRVRYPSPGVYRFRVLLDGQEQKQIALRVSAGPLRVEPATSREADEWDEIDQISPTFDELARYVDEVRPPLEYYAE